VHAYDIARQIAVLRSPAVSAKARLAALVSRCEDDLAAVTEARAGGDALATEVGGELELRWRIAVVRAAIASDGDAVRELYGELVDRYRSEPDRLAALKPLGDEIRAREADGTLPKTLVARSDRRGDRRPRR
jgi:hypothetical protein